ncbi:MAG: AI-2E family transporter, partial [Bacteroidetes bacterium]|nr:AI-2E family transporter [Bacteroidota bacterium]
LWGVIIAVALYPTYKKAESAVGGRRGLAATLVTVVMLVVMVVPAFLLMETLISGVQHLADGLRDGTLQIPPPPEGVAGWPLVGDSVAKLWTLASTNLEKALQQIGPQLEAVATWLLSAAGKAGLAVLLFFVSIIIAGVLLAKADAGARTAQKITARLVGDRGGEFVAVAETTVRSVARGVLGVAAIQASLAGIGLLVAGIPGAGLWAVLCLLLAIIQIGPLPILIPAAIYVFATADTLPAVLFLIWVIVVGLSDNVLKPILLGRGVDVPMAVVFLGTLGGFILSGIIGLFVGPVVLTLGYKLFLAWVNEGTASGAETGEA